MLTGAGYVPARILRSFLKSPGKPNIPIQAIGLSLYEALPTSATNVVEEPGTVVTRTQWLDLSVLDSSSLIGKRILIVDDFLEDWILIPEEALMRDEMDLAGDELLP